MSSRQLKFLLQHVVEMRDAISDCGWSRGTSRASNFIPTFLNGRSHFDTFIFGFFVTFSRKGRLLYRLPLEMEDLLNLENYGIPVVEKNKLKQRMENGEPGKITEVIRDLRRGQTLFHS